MNKKEIKEIWKSVQRVENGLEYLKLLLWTEEAKHIKKEKERNEQKVNNK